MTGRPGAPFEDAGPFACPATAPMSAQGHIASSGHLTSASNERGLILVTGSTGAGKSTPLAAMVDHINRNDSVPILTIEDPIEFMHRNIRSSLSQRELGHDPADFAAAMRSAPRQDPDVILVGELRDHETVDIALKAAEIGHLVLSAVHTTDAIKTISRLLSFFPVDEQQAVRGRLSEALQATVSQRLLPSTEGGTMSLAMEVMVQTMSISEYILDGTRTGGLKTSSRRAAATACSPSSSTCRSSSRLASSASRRRAPPRPTRPTSSATWRSRKRLLAVPGGHVAGASVEAARGAAVGQAEAPCHAPGGERADVARAAGRLPRAWRRTQARAERDVSAAAEAHTPGRAHAGTHLEGLTTRAGAAQRRAVAARPRRDALAAAGGLALGARGAARARRQGRPRPGTRVDGELTEPVGAGRAHRTAHAGVALPAARRRQRSRLTHAVQTTTAAGERAARGGRAGAVGAAPPERA